MLGFLIAAVSVYGLLSLLRPFPDHIAHWLAHDRDRPSPPPRRIGELDLRAVLAVIVLILLLTNFATATPLFSAQNFRLVTGAVVGALLWVFVHRVLAPKRDEVAVHDDGAGARAERGGLPGYVPLLASPGLLIPVAIFLIWLWALVAPHGELDLSGVRSVKTPVLEAQLARNKAEFVVEIEQEPRNTFVLQRSGLGHVLFMAHNELIYLSALGADAHDGRTDGRLQRAKKAYQTITKILRPVARCIYQDKERYEETRQIEQILYDFGAHWRRSIIDAVKQDSSGQAAESRNLSAKEMWHLDSSLFELINAIKSLDVQVPRLSATAKLTKTVSEAAPRRMGTALRVRRTADDQSVVDERGGEIPPCDQVQALVADPVATARFWPDSSDVLRHPAVVHAASMFALWAGEPGTAVNLVRKADDGGGRETYPGLPYVQGFALRWYRGDDVAPGRYTEHFADGIRRMEHRADVLEQHAAEQAEDCSHPGSLERRFSLNEFLEFDDSEDLTPCAVALASGYYRFRVQHNRLHIVFQSARRLLAGTRFPQRDDVLERALGHAAKLKEFVEDDALRGHNAYMRQVLEFDDPDLPVAPIASGRPDHHYALALDAYASVLLAKALRDGRAHVPETEAAIAAFDDALARAAAVGLGTNFVSEIRQKRDQAKRALNLPVR